MNKGREISPRSASPPNLASSPKYEQPLKRYDSLQIIFPYTVIQWFPFLCCLLFFFLLKPKVPKGVKLSAFAIFFVICIYLLSVKWLYEIFLILFIGDIEINPGSRRNNDETFSICH